MTHWPPYPIRDDVPDWAIQTARHFGVEREFRERMGLPPISEEHQAVLDILNAPKEPAPNDYVDFSEVREYLGYTDPDPMPEVIIDNGLAKFPCTIHHAITFREHHVDPEILAEAERYRYGTKAVWEQA